jgi:hypothetical protein
MVGSRRIGKFRLAPRSRTCQQRPSAKVLSRTRWQLISTGQSIFRQKRV